MECNKSFFDRPTYLRHLKNKHQGIKFTCSNCGQPFSNNWNRLRHQKNCVTIKTMQKDSSFKCSQCAEMFSTPSSLARHVNVVHCAAFNFNCQVCNKAFGTNFNRNRHEKKCVSQRRYTNLLSPLVLETAQFSWPIELEVKSYFVNMHEQ